MASMSPGVPAAVLPSVVLRKAERAALLGARRVMLDMLSRAVNSPGYSDTRLVRAVREVWLLRVAVRFCAEATEAARAASRVALSIMMENKRVIGQVTRSRMQQEADIQG